MAYLDHAATTPPHPEVAEAMRPFLGERFGNPSGAHATARDARRAVDEARDLLATIPPLPQSDVMDAQYQRDAAALAERIRNKRDGS